MRALGAVLVLCSGVLWGLGRARALGERERLLLDWEQLLQRLRTGIGYSASPLSQLVWEGREDSRFCREAAGDPGFSADPCKALGEAGKRLLQKPRDRELYLGFVQGLGASGVEGQLEHLELYAALVGPLLHRAREDRERRSRLYVALGAFGGMALCLALL